MNVSKLGTAEERAKRLRYIRAHGLRLSREELARRSGIPANTLMNWEQARNNGITEKGAQKFIAALQKEGLLCTPEWLLYGIGEKPISHYLQSPIPQINSTPSSEEQIIKNELDLFHQFNPNAIDTIVNDDSMSPCFWPGDHVAGIQYFNKDIRKAIGLPSIVHTASDMVILRIVEEGDSVDTYNLIRTNQHAVAKSCIENVELISAAPILWLRRRQFKW